VARVAAPDIESGESPAVHLDREHFGPSRQALWPESGSAVALERFGPEPVAARARAVARPTPPPGRASRPKHRQAPGETTVALVLSAALGKGTVLARIVDALFLGSA
jgi:hypothetical protein